MNLSINAQEHGAKGNGLTDDFPALCSALSIADSLYLPAGVYRLSQPLRMVNVDHPINIHGDGANVSILKADGCDGLDLHFQQDQYNQQPYGITIRDLGLRAHGKAGTALKVSYGSPAQTNDHFRPSTSIRDVVVESSFSGSWANGVLLEGAWNATLDNVYASGDSCGGVWNNLSGSGIELRGMAVNTHVSNCRMNFWAEGLKAHAVGRNTEGIFCVNNSLVGVKRGVWIKGDPAITHAPRISTFTWVGGLIEARVGGVVGGSAAIHLENVWDALISSSQFLAETITENVETTYGVVAQDSKGVIVSNCNVNAFSVGLCATGGCPEFHDSCNTFTNTATPRLGWNT